MTSLPASRYSVSSEKVLGKASDSLKDVLTTFQQTFVMCDATKPNTPVMFASEGFYEMTGYTAKEVIGKNCRFLQGPETDRAELEKLKQAIVAGEGWCGRILNYKKDGSTFWNLLTVSPVKDDSGNVVKFIGMQVEVTKFTEGRQDDIKRPNHLPVSLIKYDARQKEEAENGVQELLEAVVNSEVAEYSEAQVGNEQTGKPQPQPAGEIVSKKVRRKSGLGQLIAGSRPKEADNVSKLVVEAGKLVYEEPSAETSKEAEKKPRHGIDLATTLERIQKNFVITDPRLPDNPIIFASDDFLELTEYTREEVLGRNCRFLQGKDTDMSTVNKIREAIHNAQDITVQLLNYTKSGRPFWNLFHLQAVRDKKGVLQYFIGVQLDASTYVEPTSKKLPETAEKEGIVEVQKAADNIDLGLKEFPDANADLKDIWLLHSKVVKPLPHGFADPSWAAIRDITSKDGQLGLRHFRPIKPLGCGDTGSVHLVQLRGTRKLFAMKAMDKDVMVSRNKVHRACTEREILEVLDHPFLPTLYGSFQTPTHVCLITDFCSGGELYAHLDQQKGKKFPEQSAKFYAAEILLALEYLHCQGVIYRDLKPENILIKENGHILLTDFDLSFISKTVPRLVKPAAPEKSLKKKGAKKVPPPLPQLVAEPSGYSNSFVGTEEYISPEIISGVGHSSAVDWWAYGIFIYEMLYGKTPFRGRNRQRTFTNILMKELAFPVTPEVSLEAKLLIKDLLCRDPNERLGAVRGASEIKAHPWFADIQWPLIREIVAPEAETPVKFISHEDATRRDSLAIEEELEWDAAEAGEH